MKTFGVITYKCTIVCRFHQMGIPQNTGHNHATKIGN